MKRLFVSIFLLPVFINCMDHQKKVEPDSLLKFNITDQDYQVFTQHLSMALSFNIKMISDGKMRESHPIHEILQNLSHLIQESNLNGISSGLYKRILPYVSLDTNNDVISFCRNQLDQNKGNINEAQSLLFKNRLILAGQEFKKKYPSYSLAWIGELQSNNRLEFMDRNKNFPITKKSIKDYMALFIYSTVLASKKDILLPLSEKNITD